MSSSSNELVVLSGVKKYYPIKKGLFSKKIAVGKAVDGVDMMIMRGETMGLVGESGCGKTTLGRLILRLEDPTEGSILFDSNDILKYKKKKLKKLRREVQIIFQDPYSSLDPRKNVDSLVGEAFQIHKIGNKHHKKEEVLRLIQDVGLRPEQINRYPHQFSGGQRQRIGIARALSLKPKFIICDEPVSALDVSIQAQVINLLQDLQEKYQLTYLFISHDLSVVEHICDRISVMYLGKIVEWAEREALFKNPLHPYTRALLSASPSPSPINKRNRIVLNGDVPSVFEPPSGCRFHPRCHWTMDSCRREEPEMITVGQNHQVRCLKY